MRAARLLHTLLMLQTRDRVTARELAVAFEVSVRTVHRDIEALSTAGVPVYAERGARGGFCLAPGGARLPAVDLEPDEAAALPLLGLTGVAAELGLADAAWGATLKLQAALPPAHRARAQETMGQLVVDLDEWVSVPVPLQLLRGLRSAIARRRVVSLRLAPGAGQRRVVEVRPLGLVRKAGTWYLVGRGSRGYGVVAVKAIELARATGAQYEPPRGFDLPRWWRASLARRARLPTL